MGIFDWLFGPKKEDLAVFSEEAEKVASERKQVKQEADALFPSDENDPKQVIQWYEKRIALLQDARFHPVARLAVSSTFEYMILDYAGKLRDAAQGDLKAIREVKDIKAKIQSIIDEEIARLQAKLVSWSQKSVKAEEFTKIRSSKWSVLKNQINQDIERERERRNLIFPKGQKDENQWKAYFNESLVRLGNDAVALPARLTWVILMTPSEKSAMITEYLGTIDRLLSGENVEEKLHAMESQMKALILAEAERIRAKYKRFL